MSLSIVKFGGFERTSSSDFERRNVVLVHGVVYSWTKDLDVVL